MPVEAAIEDLRPTQLTLGLREVERRANEISALTARKRLEYIMEHTVPCVRGPRSQLYLIDRHHMCRALLQVGEATIRIDVLADVSELHADEFWTFMDLRGWVHPFDAQGRRGAIEHLPAKITGLQDDPYRALAGFLRREKGYKKKDTPFEEFIWADFLRRRIDKAILEHDYERAKSTAVELARSNAAMHLPGWKGGE